MIYQGAVNEGRSFETLIPAMKNVKVPLKIYGNGNFFDKALQLIKDHQLEDKVELKGLVAPAELRKITTTAFAAVMLFEDTGLNQYHSLANRFFDYIMAGVPQVCIAYPEYKTLNDKYGVACLINNTKTETIATALNNLQDDDVYYNTLQQNCLKAREELNWETEEKVLIDFYRKVFSN
ncbi:MAG: glycosyltransferase [Segetibacter sp.]